MSQVTPEQFFDKLAPTHVKGMSVPKSQRHTYVFRVFGDVGGTPGTWTIDLHRKKVTRGGSDNYDLYLEMNRSDFTNLLAETLDVPAACSAGRIRFAGNIQLLAELGNLFQSKTN